MFDSTSRQRAESIANKVRMTALGNPDPSVTDDSLLVYSMLEYIKDLEWSVGKMTA